MEQPSCKTLVHPWIWNRWVCVLHTWRKIQWNKKKKSYREGQLKWWGEWSKLHVKRNWKGWIASVWRREGRGRIWQKLTKHEGDCKGNKKLLFTSSINSRSVGTQWNSNEFVTESSKKNFTYLQNREIWELFATGCCGDEQYHMMQRGWRKKVINNRSINRF